MHEPPGSAATRPGHVVTPDRQQGRLLVGTSGYVYRDWRRRFYPADLRAADWLPYYAARFATVELNNPFYRLPAGATFARWRRQAPAGFVFAVKASRYLTHLKRLKDPEAPLALFLRRARRLEAALGPVLFQLPAQFHFDAERLDGFLTALRRQRLVPGLRAVLEVRHESWLGTEAIDRLRRAGVALCLHDWRGAPVDNILTADFVYVRRHGATRRYLSRYPDHMLAGDARRVAGWLADGRDVFVYFNNDARAYAIQNAQRLVSLLAPKIRYAA